MAKGQFSNPSTLNAAAGAGTSGGAMNAVPENPFEIDEAAAKYFDIPELATRRTYLVTV